MIGQDLAAIAVCALAFLWLVRRLLARGPQEKKGPLVSRAALLRRTAEQRGRVASERGSGGGGACH